MGFLSKIADGNKKEIKRLGKLADKVLALEEDMSILTDEEIKAKTSAFQEKLQSEEDIKKQNKILDDILPEAFALVREGSKRVFNMIPYKVQVMGGIAIHGGDISEMKTGEGKTLTATMPVYLNALTGRGVHVITVNEYLSSVQSQEMAELYEFYGEYSGCRISRKHIAWYTKGLRSSNEFRQNMYQVENTADQYKVVENYFNGLLEHGHIMSDVQVDQVNLLETK